MKNKPAGLYVHVPFCGTKCLYCDFYSVPSTSLSAEWLDALAREALLYKDRFSFFDTLFLGGGTPTLLSEKEISRLMETLYRHFRFSTDAEITLEANPNDLTIEKLFTYKTLGFNRISLGVQSMDDRDLEFLGRRHTAFQAAHAVEHIHAAGFPHLGIDLIYGLPKQTDTQWKKTLEKVLAFEPHHISCYQLTVSRGTPLARMQEQGRIQSLDEEAQRSLFLMASEFLEEQGFVHYEVSNYARRRNVGDSSHDSTKSAWSHTAGKLSSPLSSLTGGSSPTFCTRTSAAAGKDLQSADLAVHAREQRNHPGRSPSREDFYVCRHNLKYWERTPYLGLGPSAHSFLGIRRWWNHRSVQRYCEELGLGQKPVQGSETLSREQVSLEKLSLQMRTRAGTPLEELHGYEKSGEVLPRLIEQGLLEVRDQRAVPTREGFLVSDRLPLLFL